MARIRTIKPEFWSDEKIVSLPFEARLLFIGLWNYCDDSGSLDYSPERISMQIFPGDPSVNASAMLDLLETIGLIEFWVGEAGEKVVFVKNWSAHQKIDNPARKTIRREGYRKLAIPSEARVAVARKYGCLPGGVAKAECYYCGAEGEIHWHIGSRGRPTKWVYLSDLEFDHFNSELSGGDNSHVNLILACRSCNRGKREFSALQFFINKNMKTVLDSPIEATENLSKNSSGSRIKDQGRDQGVDQGGAANLPDQTPTHETEIFDGDIWFPLAVSSYVSGKATGAEVALFLQCCEEECQRHGIPLMTNAAKYLIERIAMHSKALVRCREPDHIPTFYNFLKKRDYRLTPPEGSGNGNKAEQKQQRDLDDLRAIVAQTQTESLAGAADGLNPEYVSSGELDT